MITPLLLAVVVAVAWKLMASGERFLPGFAGLLTDTRIDRSPFSFFSGLSLAAGRFRNREVAVRLQLKRNRYGQGYLVVTMRTSGAEGLDYSGIDARTRDEAGRRALSSMAAHDLLLNVEGGWLKALWRPQGFVIFPGRFSEDRWRQVLEDMQTVAVSLETSA